MRSAIADFGPAVTVLAMTALSCTPWVARIGSFTRLDLPPVALGGGGGWFGGGGAAAAAAAAAEAAAESGRNGVFVAMGQLPLRYRLLAALPALFLATLFFLGQVRFVTARTSA